MLLNCYKANKIEIKINVEQAINKKQNNKRRKKYQVEIFRYLSIFSNLPTRRMEKQRMNKKKKRLFWLIECHTVIILLVFCGLRQHGCLVWNTSNHIKENQSIAVVIAIVVCSAHLHFVENISFIYVSTTSIHRCAFHSFCGFSSFIYDWKRFGCPPFSFSL